MGVRCLFYSIGDRNTWSGCRDGYADPISGECVSNCGKGRYGLPSYFTRGLIDKSSCYSCPSICAECVGSATSDCTRSVAGYYRNHILGADKMSGQCLLKSVPGSIPTFTLYVAPPSTAYNIKYNSQTLAQTIKGQTTADAFNYIEDAILRAYELGAPTKGAKVTINLLPGSHYIRRGYVGASKTRFRPVNYDDSQTTEIVIQPSNGVVQTVYYKRRDKFTFKVGGGLTVKNLIFEAIDSSISYNRDVGRNCAQNENSNCYVNGKILSPFSVTCDCGFDKAP